MDSNRKRAIEELAKEQVDETQKLLDKICLEQETSCPSLGLRHPLFCSPVCSLEAPCRSMLCDDCKEAVEEISILEKELQSFLETNEGRFALWLSEQDSSKSSENGSGGTQE